MCASHFFSVSDSDRRLRRLVRVSRRRDDLCLLFPAPTSPPPTRGARRASSARRWLFPETRAAADRSRLFFRAARNTRQICSPSAIARAEIAPRPEPTGSAVPCVMTRPFARPESRSSRRTRRVSYPSRRPISNSPDGRRADLSIVPFLSSRRRQHGYRRQGTPFHRDLRSRRLR